MIGELIVELLKPVFEITGYYTARLAVPLLTLGQIRVERLAEDYSFPWYGVARDRSGSLVLNGELASGIGFLMLIGSGALAIWQLS